MTAEKWSSFATELSRLNEDILQTIERWVEDNQELLIGALYARANQSFLGSIQLAEAGLTDDASTLIRSMVESTIAICATARDESFIRSLIEDDAYNLNRYAKAYKEYRKEAAKMLGDDETLEAPLQVVAEDEKRSRINWAEVAKREFLTRHLYDVHYRSMSSHVHVAITSLSTRGDEHHDFTHINWRPNRGEAAETVARACDVMIWAAMQVLGFMKLEALRPQFESLCERQTSLLDDLP